MKLQKGHEVAPDNKLNSDEPEKPNYPIYPPGKPPAKKPKPPSNKAKPRSEQIKWDRPQRQATDWKELASGLIGMAAIFLLVMLGNSVLMILGSNFIDKSNPGKWIALLTGLCLCQIPLGIFAFITYKRDEEKSNFRTSGLALAIASTLLICGMSILFLPGVMCVGGVVGGLISLGQAEQRK